jgi:hypothetical protein
MATHNCVVGVEMPESRTQVVMYGGGELAVFDNVVFEANAAGDDGGAVSRPGWYSAIAFAWRGSV